ncbi:Cyclin-dependent kinase 17 [Cichlidogyrus casuarinus]|uniref:Cyclin-dependent kinase 17 n=1 Tax=Cichlidogyrus casuarinus TaxID=1844966 RepID=A0ABD2PNM4_9PLAT
MRVCVCFAGTPTEDSWPGITQHPEYAKVLRAGRFTGQDGLFHLAPRLNRRGHALLMRMLAFQGKDRITAKDAMRHCYFSLFADYASGSQRPFPLDELAHLKDIDSVFTIPGVQLARNPINGASIQVQEPLRHSRNGSNLPYPVGYAHNNRHSQIITTSAYDDFAAMSSGKKKSKGSKKPVKITQDITRSFDPYKGPMSRSQEMNGIFYPGNRNSVHCPVDMMKNSSILPQSYYMLDHHPMVKSSSELYFLVTLSMNIPVH